MNPVPKPRRKPKKSVRVPRKTPVKRRAGIKPKKRKPSEFARIYGSRERVRFVKSLPCIVCAVVGHSENAHIETGGMGRKADYTKIVPLCVWDHHVFHRLGRESLERRYKLDLDAEAVKTETAWQSYLSSSTPETEE